MNKKIAQTQIVCDNEGNRTVQLVVTFKSILKSVESQSEFLKRKLLFLTPDSERAGNSTSKMIFSNFFRNIAKVIKKLK